MFPTLVHLILNASSFFKMRFTLFVANVLLCAHLHMFVFDGVMDKFTDLSLCAALAFHFVTWCELDNFWPHVQYFCTFHQLLFQRVLVDACQHTRVERDHLRLNFVEQQFHFAFTPLHGARGLSIAMLAAYPVQSIFMLTLNVKESARFRS